MVVCLTLALMVGFASANPDPDNLAEVDKVLAHICLCQLETCLILFRYLRNVTVV